MNDYIAKNDSKTLVILTAFTTYTPLKPYFKEIYSVILSDVRQQ